MPKNTTTCHLYPEDYAVIKAVSVGQTITIPEALHVVVEGYKSPHSKLGLQKDVDSLAKSLRVLASMLEKTAEYLEEK